MTSKRSSNRSKRRPNAPRKAQQVRQRKTAPSTAPPAAHNAGVVWTPTWLASLSEADLRTQVLIPLFEAMGYQGVYHHHGGASELGKDLVMWKDDPAIGRSYYGVVAKAGDIKGGVTSSAIQTVLIQIRQSFGKPYTDPHSGEERAITTCFVVTSAGFPKEARDSIRADLGDAHRHVTFHDGASLWKLVETYLSGRLLPHYLESAAKLLNDTHPDWAIDVHIVGRDISLELAPKTPDAPPLAWSLVPRFPNTQEGLAAKEAYKEHLAVGSEVTLDGSMIERFTAPEFLQHLHPHPITSLTLFTRFILPKPLVVNFVIQSRDSAQVFEISGITLSTGQRGELETSINNESQYTPFRFRLRFPKSGNGSFSLRFDLDGHNIYRLWQAIQALTLLATGADIFFVDAETGRHLLGGQPETDFKAPSEEFAASVGKLLTIQELTATNFQIPDHSPTADELLEVEYAYIALTVGHCPVTELGLSVPAKDAQNILVSHEKEGATFLMSQEDRVISVFGQEIHLGPVEVRCKRATIHPDDLPALTSNTNDDENILFRMIPLGSEAMEAFFLNWPKPGHNP